MQHADEAALDRFDLFGVFALTFPQLQLTAARGAYAVRVIECVHGREVNDRHVVGRAGHDRPVFNEFDAGAFTKVTRCHALPRLLLGVGEMTQVAEVSASAGQVHAVRCGEDLIGCDQYAAASGERELRGKALLRAQPECKLRGGNPSVPRKTKVKIYNADGDGYHFAMTW